MSFLTPQDEFIHPVTEEPAWREAFYFDFYDPATTISAFGYAGVHPNQQIGDLIFALWRGDILLARFTRWDFNLPKDIGEDRFTFSPLSFYPVDPFKTVKFAYDDGACSMDVTFKAIHPPYNWADAHGALSQTSSHHYEQQGHYTGTVRVAGENHAINAVGARDHAWGWGNRAGIRRWLWASGQCSNQLAWNSFQITLGDGRDILYGYIFRGKENEFIRSARTATTYGDVGRAPKTLEVALEGRNGSKLSATSHMLNAFSTSFQERNKTGYHYFCFAEYQCEGKTGYGQTNVHWRLEEDRPKEWTVVQP